MKYFFDDMVAKVKEYLSTFKVLPQPLERIKKICNPKLCPK